jgi:hypothetical protein
MTPLSANSITGFKMASIGKEPNFAWTAKTPAIVPGTIARGDLVLFQE